MVASVTLVAVGHCYANGCGRGLAGRRALLRRWLQDIYMLVAAGAVVMTVYIIVMTVAVGMAFN